MKTTTFIKIIQNKKSLNINPKELQFMLQKNAKFQLVQKKFKFQSVKFNQTQDQLNMIKSNNFCQTRDNTQRLIKIDKVE